MSKISQSIQQKQNLTPQQILEANIIQLNLISLEKKILDELEKNPILEISDEEEDGELSDEENEEEIDFEWSELISNPEEFGLNKSEYSKNDFIENINALNQKDLKDDLMQQLEDLNTSDIDKKIAHEILGNLDDRGFLCIDPILIADRLNFSEKKIIEIITVIQGLNPPGICSKNMQECILSQLKIYYPNEIIAYNVINNNFEDFVNKRYKKLTTKNKCTKDEIYHIVELVSVLNPNPAINYSSYNVEHVVPDIIIEKYEGEWKVVINDSTLPSLRVNRSYLKMLEDNKDKEVKSFIKRKIDSAHWFMNAIEQRNRTFKRVMKSIMKHQESYFESDNRELTPMILKNIADDINMDISTISRATKGKYVQMPWGTKELKNFFSEGIKMKNGSFVSNVLVKETIKKIIESEDKKNPFNDESIKKKINTMGYIIARRTVSKYRESLNIPTSRLRKKII